MIFITFIYLSLLFLYLYQRRKCVDMACFVVMIYAVSAFIGILLDANELRNADMNHYEISFGATFVYCFLITVGTLPLVQFSNAEIRAVYPTGNERILKGIAWFSFMYFLVYLCLSYTDILRTLLSSDLHAARGDVYHGYKPETWLDRLPSGVAPIFALFNSLFSCSWGLLFLGFFCLFIQKLDKKYGAMLIAASLMEPLNGFINVDRSSTAYWMLSIAACYIYYRPFIERPVRRKIISVMLMLIGLFSIYMAMVTISRFSEARSGILGGLISYLGQPYIYFCYFYDTFEPPDTYLQIVFPFISKYIIGEEACTGVQIQQLLTFSTGKQLGVFYTWWGQICTAAGVVVMFIWSALVTLVPYLTLSGVKGVYVNVYRSYFFLLYSSVLFLGLFGYYYASPEKSCSVLFYLTCCFILTRKWKRGVKL